jgi:hypothetical protein
MTPSSASPNEDDSFAALMSRNDGSAAVTERLVATALGVERARAAVARTFSRTRWHCDEMTRCPRCGVLVVGGHAVTARMLVHVRCCPGGDRAADVWLPLVHRADEAPRRRPLLRLVYGGLAQRRWGAAASS